MYKNIIHITGNDSYGVELEVRRWLGAFCLKFGDINIDRYDLGDKDSMRWMGDMILMSGLFTEKRLFIFRGWRDRKSKADGIEKMLQEKSDNIPEDHYLLFHNVWEKEEWLLTWLRKNADNRKIDTLWDKDAWEKRSNIDTKALNLILSTYKGAEATRSKDDIGNPLLGHHIAHTIEMVSLSGVLQQKDAIIALCHGYGGDTMFALTDAVMSMDIVRALDILHRITATTKIDEWFGGWMGSLRNTLYIRYLREQGERESDIVDITRIHPYVVQKWYISKIPYSELQKLYNKLAMMSVAYKRGKWLKDSELWRILAIELALLDLQKSKNL